MTPSTIMGIVEDHARVHSRRLDEADQALYAWGELLALEHQHAYANLLARWRRPPEVAIQPAIVALAHIQ